MTVSSSSSWFAGWRLALLAGGLGLAVVVLVGQRVAQHVRADAVAQLLLAHDDSLIHRYQLHADSLHVVVEHDTVTLRHTVTQYQTVHDTVLRHLTDTVTVKEFVQAADTAIHACQRALGDCAQETAALRAELLVANDKAVQLTRLQPTFLERHTGVVALLAAVAGTYLGSRLK